MSRRLERLKKCWARLTCKLRRRSSESGHEVSVSTRPAEVESNGDQPQNIQHSDNKKTNPVIITSSTHGQQNVTSTGTGSAATEGGNFGCDHPTSPFSSSPIQGHIHHYCSRCQTTIDYDHWNSCTKGNRPNLVPREGPCNHCVRAGEKPALDCRIIRCEKCLEEGGMTYALRRRNQKLAGLGYQRVTNVYWEKPGFSEKWGRAPWDLVRYGPCTDKKTFPQKHNLEVRYSEL